MTKDMSFKRAMVTIIAITCLTTSVMASFLFGPIFIKYWRSQDPCYAIQAIVVKSTPREKLPSSLFAEFLNLSVDHPTNIYAFNSQHAASRLMKLGIFSSLEIKKIMPNIVMLTYAMRKPVAYLGNKANTMIDSDGVFIPFYPFYTPKILPKVYLSEQNVVSWGEAMPAEVWQMLLPIIQYAHDYSMDYLDLRNVENNEIIAMTGTPKARIIRLTKEGIEAEIAKYNAMQKQLEDWELSHKPLTTIVDLRFKEMALLTNSEFDINFG